MKPFLGVDGCPGGWAVVRIPSSDPSEAEALFAPAFAPLVPAAAAIAVDIPIGLPDRITGPGRVAEQAVRPVLGPRRASVFSVPSRAAVYAPTYDEACAVAAQTSDPPRKISRQAFHILDKVREVDAALTPDTQHTVFEVHAEMAFWRLNGDTPMPTPKKVRRVPAREALASRIALLVGYGFLPSFFEKRVRGVPLVDMVDAAAMALIAVRCRGGIARPFPDPPGVDARGLRIAIWA